MNIIAKAILMDGDGKILVLRRSHTHPLFAYHLDFPGGQAEQEEAGVEAVVREIFEETGLVIDDALLELAHEKRMSERAHYVVYVARLNESEPQIAISWEHDQFEWLSRSDLLAREAPASVDRYYTTVIDYLAGSEL